MSTTRPAWRTLGIVVIVLLLLGICFALFSYSYIWETRDYLTKRNLRAVGVLASQLKLKIDNYSGSVLPSLALAAKECEASNRPCALQALSQQAKTAAGSRSAPAQQPLRKDALSAAAGDRDRKKLFNAKLKETFLLAPSLKLEGPARFSGGQEPERVTIISPDRQSSQLTFEYSGPVAKVGYRVTFGVLATFDDLVGTFGKDVFDNILIVSSTKDDNTVIFQKPPSGAQVTRLNTVRDRKGAEVPFASVRSSSDVFELNLAGATYKAFLQPLRLATTRFPGDAFRRETVYGDWTVCGLVRADTFRTESLAISYTVVLVFLFVFVMVTASWPLLKLWSIRTGERLGRSDVILASISVLTISGLLTFFLADMYAYRRLDDTLDGQLERFAETIVTSFQSEVQQLERALKYLDDRMNDSTTAKFERRKIKILMDPELNLTPFHAYFEIVSQTGVDGMQVKKWTIKNAPTPLISVAERNYFKKIRKGQGWPLDFGDTSHSGTSNVQYWLEPIISWTTGETRVELSRQSDKTEQVVSITARLISLQHPVTPPGLGYAVLDEDGTVLFHSDLSRTLAENFVQECDGNRLLRSHLESRASEWINAAYMGRAHRLYIMPLRGLPWTLIVFRDKEIARTVNLEMLSAAIILYFCGGLVFLLPVLLFCMWRPDWMWPDPNRLADYKLLLAAHALLIVLSLSEFFVFRHHHVPFLAFLLPPFTFLLTYLELREGVDPSWRYRTVSLLLLMALPVLLLVFGAYDVDEARAGGGEHLVRLFVLTLVQAMAMYGILVFVLRPPQPFHRALNPSTRPLQKIGLRFRAAYLLLGTTLMLIISVAPALVIFRAAHDTEMETLVKHGQFHLAHSFAARDERVRDEYRGVALPSGYVENRICDRRDRHVGFFFDTRHVSVPIDQSSNCTSQEHLFEQAMEKVRPIYNDIAVETHELVHDATADCSFQWRSGKTYIELASVATATGALARFLPMQSDIPTLRWPATFWGWFGVAAMILLTLAIIYWLVRFVGKRIFLLDLFLPAPISAPVTDLGEVTENTLVLGMPHSGTSALLARFKPLDIRQIVAAGTWQEHMAQELSPEREIVAIDHFESAMDDPECNSLKLRLLEKFVHANRTLVVASACDPNDFPLSQPDQANGKPAKDEDEKVQQEELERAARYRDRWANVWSTFTRRVYVTATADTDDKLKMLQEAILASGFTPAVADKLHRECAPTERLRSIGIAIARSLAHAELSEEQVVIQVLDHARAYYRALWATCAREEKIALFDLAQDGFVNATPTVLQRLAERGLILRSPRVRLMNESFRRFAAETGVQEAVIALQKEEWSPWMAIRGTLVIAAIAVAMFVFLTQKELLNRSTAFIGAVSGGIPALVKLFDFFRERRTGV
jgi:hypothetical protein